MAKRRVKDKASLAHAQFEREAEALEKDRLNFQGELDSLLLIVRGLEERVVALELLSHWRNIT